MSLKQFPRLVGVAFACQLAAGCHQSPYDFPIVTMVGPQRGYSMTGYIATHDDAVARAKVTERLRGVCPQGASIVDFKTERADAAIGTHILHYEALATCTTN